MNAHTLYLISGPIRFAASDDDAKRLAQELQANNCELARLRAEVERLRTDAELYRWLRDCASIVDLTGSGTDEGVTVRCCGSEYTGDTLEDAIAAAVDADRAERLRG